jgi:hypothetical protein
VSFVEMICCSLVACCACVQISRVEDGLGGKVHTQVSAHSGRESASVNEHGDFEFWMMALQMTLVVYLA